MADAAAVDPSAAPEPTLKPEFQVTDISPRNLDKLVRSGKNVFLALYSPNLPKWQNFSSTLSLLGERFAGNDSKLLVVKGNCREHPVSVGAAWVLCVFEAHSF